MDSFFTLLMFPHPQIEDYKVLYPISPVYKNYNLKVKPGRSRVPSHILKSHTCSTKILKSKSFPTGPLLARHCSKGALPLPKPIWISGATHGVGSQSRVLDKFPPLSALGFLILLILKLWSSEECVTVSWPFCIFSHISRKNKISSQALRYTTYVESSTFWNFGSRPYRKIALNFSLLFRMLIYRTLSQPQGFGYHPHQNSNPTEFCINKVPHPQTRSRPLRVLLFVATVVMLPLLVQNRIVSFWLILLMTKFSNCLNIWVNLANENCHVPIQIRVACQVRETIKTVIIGFVYGQTAFVVGRAARVTAPVLFSEQALSNVGSYLNLHPSKSSLSTAQVLSSKQILSNLVFRGLTTKRCLISTPKSPFSNQAFTRNSSDISLNDLIFKWKPDENNVTDQSVCSYKKLYIEIVISNSKNESRRCIKICALISFSSARSITSQKSLLPWKIVMINWLLSIVDLQYAVRSFSLQFSQKAADKVKSIVDAAIEVTKIKIWHFVYSVAFSPRNYHACLPYYLPQSKLIWRNSGIRMLPLKLKVDFILIIFYLSSV